MDTKNKYLKQENKLFKQRLELVRKKLALSSNENLSVDDQLKWNQLFNGKSFKVNINKINSMNLQNEPSTSENKQNSPKM
ncbi:MULTISPECIES: hypothetical protein [unclassified Spiroplasma]|uniref:hypothetical protein n=1 Tax=unclassified Spiroplasma TaxID=2637901 RepID=UPI0013C5A68B|nr:hypothetical protein [Spiroplasma endosymbiont of Danaus chrysippus]CAB1053491.1 hypothetical protein [Spiroplasma endosymbiont of Danaus chrysippus]